MSGRYFEFAKDGVESELILTKLFYIVLPKKAQSSGLFIILCGSTCTHLRINVHHIQTPLTYICYKSLSFN